MDNLENMNRYLEKIGLPRLNQEEIEIMNNPIMNTEIKTVIKKFLETKDNENTTQNLWDAVKAVLRGKFTAISYLKKQEKH